MAILEKKKARVLSKEFSLVLNYRSAKLFLKVDNSKEESDGLFGGIG